MVPHTCSISLSFLLFFLLFACLSLTPGLVGGCDLCLCYLLFFILVNSQRMLREVSYLQKDQFLPCEELEEQQGDGCVEGK